MDGNERVITLAQRLKSYDEKLYSELENYMLSSRKEELMIDFEDIEDSEGFGDEVARALSTLEGEPRERFKKLLKSGKWVQSLTEAARQQTGQPAAPKLTPQEQDAKDWQEEQARLKQYREQELKSAVGRHEREKIYIAYEKKGLGKPYLSPQAQPTQADLEAGYRQELAALDNLPGARSLDAVAKIRQRYRAAGLETLGGAAPAQPTPATPQQIGQALGTGPQADLMAQYRYELSKASGQEARLVIRDKYRREGLKI